MTPEQLDEQAKAEAAELKTKKAQKAAQAERLNQRRNDLYERQLLKEMGVEL